MTNYDADPEAIAWARAKVEHAIEKMRRMSTSDSLSEENRRGWRKAANLLQMDLLGGEGCVIAAFDERLPKYTKLIEEAKGQKT